MRRHCAREGWPRGTGAHWPGSPCPVPLSCPVARGGDARGGEEAVPAAPPPPPLAAPAPPTGPRGGGGQGASPGRQAPLGCRGLLGARVVRGALTAEPGRCERAEGAACATHQRAPSGPALCSAAQPREAARRTPARRRPPSSRLFPERGLARPCQAGRTEPVRSARGLAPSGGWMPASATPG